MRISVDVEVHHNGKICDKRCKFLDQYRHIIYKTISCSMFGNLSIHPTLAGYSVHNKCRRLTK